MSINPIKANLNRSNEIKSNVGDVKKSVGLFDIDYAMMTYLEDVALPKLDYNGKSVSIPVIYGNSERWKGARRDGVYRDKKGSIQLPLMMLRRTSIAKDETMPMQNRHVSYPTITRYSKDNRYDRFTALGSSVKPKYELFNIVMPDYVEVNYECMVWTDYPYYDNKDLIDFLSLNNSKTANPTTNNTITFNDVKLIKTPSQLESVINAGISVAGNSYDIKAYINGTRYYQTSHFTVSITLNSLTINFIQANLGFTVDTNDEIIITGKFIDIE